MISNLSPVLYSTIQVERELRDSMHLICMELNQACFYKVGKCCNHKIKLFFHCMYCADVEISVWLCSQYWKNKIFSLTKENSLFNFLNGVRKKEVTTQINNSLSLNSLMEWKIFGVEVVGCNLKTILLFTSFIIILKLWWNFLVFSNQSTQDITH